MEQIIQDLATLFDAESMDELDASDFKDKAGEIWYLVENARYFLNLRKVKNNG